MCDPTWSTALFSFLLLVPARTRSRLRTAVRLQSHLETWMGKLSKIGNKIYNFSFFIWR